MRRGFALLAILWVVAALAGLVGSAVATMRTGHRETRNRILLTRERWAAQACAEIAQSEWLDHPESWSGGESLGGDTRCTWDLHDPFIALNANLADSLSFATTFVLAGYSSAQADDWANRILRRRESEPIENIAQLTELDSLPRSVTTFLTVEGTGQISSGAPGAVLATLPGMTNEAIALLQQRSAQHRPISSLDELSGLLSLPARSELETHYAELSGRLVFGPHVLILDATGLVGSDSTTPPQSVECLLGLQPGRLAIVRRRLL